MNNQETRLKDFKGQKYTGMNIGDSHHWNYTECEWKEQKVAPDKWKIEMTSVKRRKNPTKFMGGIDAGTQYHWYIMADQIVEKLDENSYETKMMGTKMKIGHKRPYWRQFSYKYEDQVKLGRSETQLKIGALKREIDEIATKGQQSLNMTTNYPG